MLQHNSPRAATAKDRAHLAHAAMIALHALCCGLPIAALFLTAASGASTGYLAFSTFADGVHGAVHRQETWILAGSAALVVLGGVLELTAHRHEKRGFPWLFALSVCCFLLNLSLIAVHRFT